MQTSLGKTLFILIMISHSLYAYNFTMHLDKTQPMIGEKCLLTLDFRYQDLEEYEIEEPHFDNVEVTLLEEKESKDTNGTWHATARYQLIPYKAGKTTLAPLKTHIEMIEKQYQNRYNKSSYLQKFDIFTQPIMIDIHPPSPKVSQSQESTNSTPISIKTPPPSANPSDLP